MNEVPDGLRHLPLNEAVMVLWTAAIQARHEAEALDDDAAVAAWLGDR